MVNYVIFDIDGTLIDSVDLHAKAWQEAFREFGFDLPYETVRHQIGKGGDKLIPSLITQEAVDRIGKQLEEYRGKLFKRDYMPRVRPFPCVRELFERIRKDGKKIALASSAKGDELQVYKRLVKVEDLVQEETSKDDAKESKPEPDIIAAALDKLGNPAHDETVMIGDTPYDAIAARKIGVPTIGVLSGGFPDHELRDAGCVEIYADVADILANYSQSLLGREQEKIA